MTSGTEFKPTGSLPELRWREMCTHVRTTDEISFKLLGAVPLVSGAAIGASLLKSDMRFTPLLVLLSLFAAGITAALRIWERRNIQTCNWVRARAAELEEQAFGETEAGHFARFPAAPGGKGKAAAEKIAYGLTIAAWLVLPLAAGLTSTRIPGLNMAPHVVYAVAATCVGIMAAIALRTRIEITPSSASRRTAAATFGAIIRRLRADRGLTQGKLAELADLNVSYIVRLERGENDPTLTIALDLAEALHVDAAGLFSEIAQKR